MKAQMVGQIFIYLLAIIVAGGILIYGYNAIKTFGQQAEDVSYVKFKTLIENDFKEMASDFGSVRIKSYEPGKLYEEACFVDKRIIDAKGQGYTGILLNYPIIQDSIETGTRFDLYLVPGEQQIDLGLVEVTNPEGMDCIEIKNGKFSVRIEGTGKSTIVSES